jgi:uncharacterized protein (UPF0276 family)
VPARAGVGLKPEHDRTILSEGPDVGFFEIHAENYMGAGGPPHRHLEAIRARYPLSIHGVGLSIGGHGPLDRAHLARLKRLVDRYQPGLVSEHLAWSTHDGVYLNDLLPLPYTTETLVMVRDHVDEVQTVLGRRILLENPSAYLAFAESTFSETAFLAEIAQRTGCGLLLDVGNVEVSAVNLGFDARTYLDAFPLAPVGEVHLGGNAAVAEADGGPLLIDTHGAAIGERGWALYAHLLERLGAVPTLIEWDHDVPTWPALLAEARRAQDHLDRLVSARNRLAEAS